MFVGILLFCFTSSSSNYKKHEDHKTQGTQDKGSTPRQNPTTGENPNNPLLIESYQNETFKTQRPSLRPPKAPSQPSK